MTAKVILNPYSNRWNSQKRWAEAEAALTAAGVKFELAVSERKGQLVQLAAQAAREKFSPIIVAGGDGSVGDVANGLMQPYLRGGEVPGSARIAGWIRHAAHTRPLEAA